MGESTSSVLDPLRLLTRYQSWRKLCNPPVPTLVGGLLSAGDGGAARAADGVLVLVANAERSAWLVADADVAAAATSSVINELISEHRSTLSPEDEALNVSWRTSCRSGHIGERQLLVTTEQMASQTTACRGQTLGRAPDATKKGKQLRDDSVTDSGDEGGGASLAVASSIPVHATTQAVVFHVHAVPRAGRGRMRIMVGVLPSISDEPGAIGTKAMHTPTDAASSSADAAALTADLAQRLVGVDLSAVFPELAGLLSPPASLQTDLSREADLRLVLAYDPANLSLLCSVHGLPMRDCGRLPPPPPHGFHLALSLSAVGAGTHVSLGRFYQPTRTLRSWVDTALKPLTMPAPAELAALTASGDDGERAAQQVGTCVGALSAALANGQLDHGTELDKFEAAGAFDGPRPGFVFKAGPHGTGYYADASKGAVQLTDAGASLLASAPRPASMDKDDIMTPQTAVDADGRGPSASGQSAPTSSMGAAVGAEPLLRAHHTKLSSAVCRAGGHRLIFRVMTDVPTGPLCIGLLATSTEHAPPTPPVSEAPTLPTAYVLVELTTGALLQHRPLGWNDAAADGMPPDVAHAVFPHPGGAHASPPHAAGAHAGPPPHAGAHAGAPLPHPPAMGPPPPPAPPGYINGGGEVSRGVPASRLAAGVSVYLEVDLSRRTLSYGWGVDEAVLSAAELPALNLERRRDPMHLRSNPVHRAAYSTGHCRLPFLGSARCDLAPDLPGPPRTSPYLPVSPRISLPWLAFPDHLSACAPAPSPRAGSGGPW